MRDSGPVKPQPISPLPDKQTTREQGTKAVEALVCGLAILGIRPSKSLLHSRSHADEQGLRRLTPQPSDDGGLSYRIYVASTYRPSSSIERQLLLPALYALTATTLIFVLHIIFLLLLTFLAYLSFLTLLTSLNLLDEVPTPWPLGPSFFA
jgi:hypothetical protein